jgi:hypothetical protein
MLFKADFLRRHAVASASLCTVDTMTAWACNSGLYLSTIGSLAKSLRE